MAAITTATLDGFFKQVYGDDVPDLIPRDTKLQNKLKFVTREKELGGKYNQPVRLADSAGLTFAGPNAGAFTLAGAVPLTVRNASIDGSQIVLQEQVDYETLARAQRSKNAFKEGTAYIFEGMQKSIRKALEIELFYGQMGLGVVASTASNVITLTAAEFASGIWAGSEGMAIEIWDTTGAVQRTGTPTITAVNIEGYTITVSALPTGTVATDIIYFKGAKGNEMAGLHKVLSNTGALFGIDASQYTLWKAANYGAGAAALSQAKIGGAIAAAVNRGLNDDLVLLVNPKTWNNLLSDQAALRRYTEAPGRGGRGSGAVYQTGAESIEFFSQNGKVEVTPCIYVKEGYSFGISPENWLRIGATDITFKTPGYGDQIFFQLPTAAGAELRAYTHQALFCEKPGANVLVTGIVNV